MFWFATSEHVQAGDLLNEAVWKVAGQPGSHRLID